MSAPVVKSARFHIETVSLMCSHCDELLEDENGEQGFFIDNFERDALIECGCCGTANGVPESLVNESRDNVYHY